MCIVVPFGKPNPSFHFWGLSLWISHSYCHCLILRISCFIPLTGQKNKKVKRVFLDRVQNSSLELEHGDDALKRLITATPRSGFEYCLERDITPCTPTITNVVSFLTGFFETGLSYSTVNGAQSAIMAWNLEGQSDKFKRILNGFMKDAGSLRKAGSAQVSHHMGFGASAKAVPKMGRQLKPQLQGAHH